MRARLFSVAALVLVAAAGLAPIPILAEETNVLALGDGDPSRRRAALLRELAGGPGDRRRPEQRLGLCRTARLRNNVFVFEMVGPGHDLRLRVRHRRHRRRRPRRQGRHRRGLGERQGQRLPAGPQGQPRGPRRQAALRGAVEGRGSLRAADHRRQPRRPEVDGADGLPRLRQARPERRGAGHLGHLRDQLQQVPPAPAGHGAGRLLRVQQGPLRRHRRGPGDEARLDPGQRHAARRCSSSHRTARASAATGGTAPTRTLRPAATGTARAAPPRWAAARTGRARSRASCDKGLAASGRARLYGILFDTDSARIRPESLATLDEVVKMLIDRAGLADH